MEADWEAVSATMRPSEETSRGRVMMTKTLLLAEESRRPYLRCLACACHLCPGAA